MLKNLTMPILLVLILAIGWVILTLRLPFYQETIFIIIISLLIMTIINEKFIFGYTISIILVYGAVLTLEAFLNNQSGDMQLLYIYAHLLVTSLLVLYWILLDQLKNIGTENIDLKRQIQVLKRYTNHTEILTINEFMERASWLLKTSERQKKEAWLVEIIIKFPNKLTQENLRESLEYLAGKAIRQKYDLVTSTDNSIILLLQNASENGVKIMLERYYDQVKSELNLIKPPYTIQKKLITSTNQLPFVMDAVV